MKKLLALTICIVLALSFCVNVEAASASLAGASSIVEGATAQYTVSVSGCPDATSASVSVSVGNNLTVQSGSWNKSGGLCTFDQSTNKGAIGSLASPNINGSLFSFTVKGNKQSTAPQSVTVTVTAKNGAEEILSQTKSVSVTVTCATHNFGSYTKLNDSQHARTCSACGYQEKANHSWNGGTVTKQANCKEPGTSEYTCTVCGAKTTKTIAQTSNHTLSAYKTTKQATCTQKGEETATCSTCGKLVTKSVSATGHSFSKWETEKEPTCTENGVKKRTCSKCNAEEKQNINPLGHDFESPKLIKQATLFSNGLIEGKCKRCGEKTQEIIACNYVDETNKIKIETSEGSFSEGTEIKIEILDKNSENYETYKTELLKNSAKFKIYNISAVKNGEKVEPNGKIKITFNDVDKFSENALLYCLADDGSFVKTDSSASEDGKSITAESEKMGVFALCSQDKAKAENKKPVTKLKESDSKNSFRKPYMYVGAALAVCVVGFAVFEIISIRRKRF